MNASSTKEIWDATLGELQLQLSRANYDTWLKQTVGVTFQDGLFTVGAPTAFATEWLERRLYTLIRKTVMGITGQDVEVKFVVQPQPIMKRSGVPSPSGRSGNGHSGLPHPTYLNPKYTFASFVVGSSNRLAHAGALSVAENPGRSYNPLFIYGGVGLGKTHLLHAIGHVAYQNNYNCLYVSSEHFTNEFINAIRERKTEEFRSRYRALDVLLIDDIQFIAGKEQTQEGFFHTFNDLHNANRQIIISSDRPPRSMPLLEARLRSRFEWGLIADIQPPDLETRLAILRAKAEEQEGVVPAEVINFIAQKVHDNIRELEGSLNRIIAYARLTKSELTLELAAEAMANLMPSGARQRRLNPPEILEAVARHYSITVAQIQSRKRDKSTSLSRQVAMYLIREETSRPLTEIGAELGGRDHSTVLHGCEKIARDIESDPALRRDVLEIRAVLYSPEKKGNF